MKFPCLFRHELSSIVRIKGVPTITIDVTITIYANLDFVSHECEDGNLAMYLNGYSEIIVRCDCPTFVLYHILLPNSFLFVESH